MKRLKEKILEDNQLPTPSPMDGPTPSASSSTGSSTPSTPSHNQMILMFMALVCLLSLPSVFVYFLHITLFSLKIKSLSMENRIKHQNDVICFRSDDEKNLYNKWLVLISFKKNIEDSIKDRLIITATTTGIFFALKAANVKLPKASLDAMDIMKLAGGICGGVLVKDYTAYKKWITEWHNKKFYGPLGHEINTTPKADPF